MNKYERNLMFNIVVMKIIYLFVIILNMVFSLKQGELFYFSPLQLLVSIIWVFGLLSGMGYLGQRIPILPVGIIRIIEFIYYGLILPDFMNWISFAICVCWDVIFITFLFIDKARYEYVKEVDDNGDA